MIAFRFLLILFFISITQISFAQTPNEKYKDSLIQEININNDSVFYIELISTIEDNGRLEKSAKIEIIDVAISRVTLLNYELTNAKLYFLKSIYKTIEGDYTAAIQLLQPNLQIFEKHNSIYAAKSYNTMGNMINRLGDKELAIKYLKKAMELAPMANVNEKDRAKQYINNNLVLGNIYFSHNQLLEAEYYFNFADSLSYLDSLSISKEKCFSLTNLAKLELKKGNYRKCIQKNNAAIAMAIKNKYPDIEAYGNLRTGMAYANLKRYDSALISLNQAEKITKENIISTIQLEIILQRSNLYRQQGFYKNSLIEMDRYIQVKENLEKQNKSARASYLIAQTQKEEKEKAFNILNQLKEDESKKRKKLFIIFGIVIGALLISTFVLRLWLKQSKLIKQEKLEKQIISGQLKALSAQMNPHFIFNSLNSIQDLILKQDSTQAYDYIGKFALLIRNILDHSEKEFIDIEDEFQILNLYLELEKLRFQKGFKYTLETNGIKDIEIPPMLIQPFVENAIKHGLLHKKGFKSLEVTFNLDENILKISILDNGIGRKAAYKIKERQKKIHNSFSGQSMEKRLEILQKQYDGNFNVEYIDIENKESNNYGTKVIISSPYKRRF